VHLWRGPQGGGRGVARSGVGEEVQTCLVESEAWTGRYLFH
jgi:hypothetical protein